MPRPKKSLALSLAGRNYLTTALKAISRPSPSSFRGRAQHLALSFRPSRQGRDAIPDQPIPLDAFHLLALSYRRSDNAPDGRRWRVALAIYKPRLDFPGSGQVVFRCDRAYDVTVPHRLVRPQLHTTAVRSAVVMNQACEDADPADLASVPRWPSFFYGFDPGSLPNFDPIEAPAAGAAERIIDGLRAWPAEFFVRDGRSTLTRHPTQVFASLAGLKGRMIRNPAFSVLKQHGLLPESLGYRAWRDTVSRFSDGGRIFQDPRVEGTEANWLRRAIEDFVVADPAREHALLADLGEACHALGVRIDEGSGGIDALAELLDNPWNRAVVPYAAGIQVVKLAGWPGPATMSFSDGVAQADLFDLGRGHDRFESPSLGTIRR